MSLVNVACVLELPVPTTDSQYTSYEQFEAVANVEVASGVEYYAGRYMDSYTECDIESVYLLDEESSEIPSVVLDDATNQYIIDLACEQLDNV